MPFAFGELPYSLLQILLFSYDSVNDTYGDPYELPADITFDVEPQADTDELRDSGAISEGLTVATHATVTIGTGGYPADAIRIMEGAEVGYNGTNDVREIDSQAGGSGMPYFGAIGVAPAKGGGVLVAGLPKVLIDAPLAYSMDGSENAFITQEAAGRALTRNNRFHKRRYYQTLDLWVTDIPASGADFKTWLDTIYSGSGS